MIPAQPAHHLTSQNSFGLGAVGLRIGRGQREHGTFGDGVALVERVDGGGEGGEAGEFDGLAEALQVQHGRPDGVHALPNLIDAVRVEESVPRRRLEEQVQRHLFAARFAGGRAAAEEEVGWVWTHRGLGF
jgi:hypothetical protein